MTATAADLLSTPTLGDGNVATIRQRRIVEPLPALTGAATAALIVALEAPSMAWGALAMTFVVFVLVGAALGRRRRWSAMLPFTRVLVALLYPVVAAVVVWVMMDATAMTQASVATLAIAAASAAIATMLARRLAAPRPTRIAVVGSARSADQLQREMLGFGVRDQEIVGLVVTAQPASDRLHRGAVPVLGEIADLAEVLERNEVDVLLIDGEASRTRVFDQLAETCLDLPVRACELTQFYEDALGHVPVRDIDSAWFRYMMHPRFRSPDTIAKRTLDLAVVLVAGILFAPIIAVCALLIKLHDRGPVLFCQRRIGSRGREFTLLKLRTMRTGPGEARWSSLDDDRVTPIGRVLRRTHLDEIPQLLNVLRGEMSVVGPRPEQPEFVEHLERMLPYYNRRHLIKPGLTGWAQVRCGYAGSDAGSAWKLCHDLFYLKHQSLGLDLAILAETARTLVADRQFPRHADRGAPEFVALTALDAAARVQPAGELTAAATR
jgi:exopolysaccharide biosynthesis polyprenyl glycosylphosphotransferase